MFMGGFIVSEPLARFVKCNYNDYPYYVYYLVGLWLIELVCIKSLTWSNAIMIITKPHTISIERILFSRYSKLNFKKRKWV